ncbi:MAG: hypothetical protein QOI54_3236 [Actinomycetota bacterium]|nr:hypothetical protein [Actinomycetota bacterium]
MGPGESGSGIGPGRAGSGSGLGGIGVGSGIVTAPPFPETRESTNRGHRYPGLEERPFTPEA